SCPRAGVRFVRQPLVNRRRRPRVYLAGAHAGAQPRHVRFAPSLGACASSRAGGEMTRTHAWLAAAAAAVALGTAAGSSGGGGAANPVPAVVGGVVPVQLPGLQKKATIAQTTTIVPAAITADGKFIYALAQDGVIPVDLATSRLLPAIKTGQGPRAMAITQ